MAKKNNTNKSAKSTKEPKEKRNYEIILSSLSPKNSLYLFLSAIMVLMIVVFFDFITFNKLYLFKDIGSDTINGIWNVFLNDVRIVYQDIIPKWSHAFGMGQNNWRLINVGDPFNVLFFVFGPNALPYMFGIVEFLKIATIGFLIYKYFSLLSRNNLVSIIAGIAFAMSGYVIIGSGWYLFTTETLIVSLLLLGLELFIQKKNWYLIPFAYMIAGMFQPFFMYLITVFVVIYVLFKIFTENFTFRQSALLYLKIAMFGAIGVGLAGFILTGNILMLLNSPRVGGDASHTAGLAEQSMFALADYFHNYTAIMRFFSNDLIGNGSAFKGWQNYLEAPTFYSSLLVLLLVPQIFQFLDKKKKIIVSAILSAYAIGVIFPYFRHIFWLFTGDYYRTYSLHITFFMLLFAMLALKYILEKGKLNRLLLLITYGIFLVLLTLLSTPEKIIISSVQYAVIFFLSVYTILLLYITNKNYSKAIQIALLALFFIELAYFNYNSVNDRNNMTSEELTQKIGYNDYTVDAVEYLKLKDNSFYRIEKDYASGLAIHSSMNDGIMQGYYGTTSYNSFNQINYIRFLGGVKIIDTKNESQTRWAQGLRGRPILFSAMNGKYFFSKNPKLDLTPYGFDSIAQFSDVRVLGNRYFLPLGYTYSACISKSEFEKLSTSQMDIMLLKSFVAEDEDITKFDGLTRLTSRDTTREISYSELDSITNLKRKESMAISYFGQSKISGLIKLETKKMVFFSIPYDKGWTAKVNDEEKKPELVNLGFMGLVLDKGVYNVELEYNPPYMIHGILLSLVSVCIFIGLVFWDVRKKKKIQITT